MAKFNAAALDGLFAHGMSAFSEAEIPSLESEFPESKYWIGTHAMVTFFAKREKSNVFPLMAALLRRLTYSFKLYGRGRAATLSYLNELVPGEPDLAGYIDALLCWESCLLNSQMATTLFNRMGAGRAFAKGDGSIEERVWDIANEVKHFGEDLDLATPSSMNIQPLWMSNAGLETKDHLLRWDDLASHIRDLAGLAEQLKDPRALAELASAEEQPNSA